ncbi:MAG: TonB-dependent receptor [Ignavibacteriales bacterium]|nr:TonB-dependent receptor [Ignavibacteriales bacterium]
MKTALFLRTPIVMLMVIAGWSTLFAQGVTTASITGIVTTTQGQPLEAANVVAVHEPSGTVYGAASRSNGQFNLPNLRVGGPYTVTASYLGYRKESRGDIYLSLNQESRISFSLVEEALTAEEVVVTAELDEVMNSGRTGAATFIGVTQVTELPTVKRSTRDLARIDPRSDGNYSFGGKNWLYNNISLDGSYFNNSFGLDDPAPGGQTNAEPIPFDAVEQVQVSVAPFDVREGGFTGANINTVTKSGTNHVRASLYSFLRNENFIGNKVFGRDVIANPDLFFNQSGISISGPVIENKLFFFLNYERERREDPGTNFVADRDGNVVFGESRVSAATMDLIRTRMKTVYGYETGPYEGYIHETKNDKLLAKLDWNVDENNNVSFRVNILDAKREQGPHPFVLSFQSTGRGPNESSLPFRNSGYAINNELQSYALEWNTRSERYANRLFVSYNRFRDFREPFSEDFPTIEIGENGITYTTIGHEPFSIHNILNSDVWQFTNNFNYFTGDHVLTVGANYETFTFFNSFNLFRHGLFGLPFAPTTFFSLADFLNRTALPPSDPNFPDFRGMITPSSSPFKGEDIKVGQFSVYAQDEYLASERLNLTFGLRVDFPIYFTEPVANPYSTGLLNADGVAGTIDQSKLPGSDPLFSPRFGFNYDLTGDRSSQLRGGTGIFTGRLPFVWIGNVISNPGSNPNLPAHLRSFDVNAVESDFKWPQVWNTNLAIDHRLPWDVLGTLEILYGKDLNAVVVRNADLRKPVRFLADGRPYYGGFGANENNAVFPGDGGIYVLGNTSEGYHLNITAQLRKQFTSGLSTSISYTYLMAKSQLKSTEIASVLWAENPVQGDPNSPELSYSEFGNRHRITGVATYRHQWSETMVTSIGIFGEIAEGSRFAGAGGNRYSFVYSGDVNGDGNAGNDLIYIPRNQTDARLVPGPTGTVAEQWAALNAFIEQDDYLSANRGKVAERFGAVNPWFLNVDLKVLHDISFFLGPQRHTFQLSFDVLNLPNLLNSDWGIRKSASPAATSPLTLVGFDGNGNPQFNFTGPKKTYSSDPGLLSRWQAQFGIRYIFN